MRDAAVFDAVTRRRRVQSPALRKLIAHPAFIIGFSILAIILVVAILGHWFVPHSPMAISVRNRFIQPGNPSFWLGTDHLGRDLLSRLIVGAGVSLRIGLMVAALSGVAGTIIGA